MHQARQRMSYQFARAFPAMQAGDRQWLERRGGNAGFESAPGKLYHAIGIGACHDEFLAGASLFDQLHGVLIRPDPINRTIDTYSKVPAEGARFVVKERERV